MWNIAKKDAGKFSSVPLAWQRGLGYLVFFTIVILIAYWGTFFNMVGIWWRSETFAHGFLILPISLYLIWQKRNRLEKVTPEPVMWGWLLVLLLNILWLMAYLVDIQVAQQFLVVAMLAAVTLTLFGLSVIRVIWFPLLYLFFAVPFGEFLIPSLQDITAEFTVSMLRITGIPVLLEGRFLSIPSGNFEVAEACSGLRYLIASLALGVLYAYIAYINIYKRLVFILMAMLVPIIANGFRAYGIVMIAHLSDYKLATGLDHLVYGWLFFGLVIFLLIWIGSFFRDEINEGKKVVSESVLKDAPSAPTAVSIVLTGLFVVASGPLSASWLERPFNNMLSAPDVPVLSNEWKGPYQTDLEWGPVYLGPTSESKVKYIKGKDEVQIYVAFYGEQKQDSELINSENAVFKSKGWRRLSEQTKIVMLDEQESRISIQETIIQSKNGKKLLWHWNQIGDISTVNTLRAKLAEARYQLFRKQVGSAAIILAIDYDSEIDGTEKLMIDFFNSFYPVFTQTFAGIQNK